MAFTEILAAEERRPGALAHALEREVMAALRLLDRYVGPGRGRAVMPIVFRFVATNFNAEPGEAGADREVVVSVTTGGLATTERAVPAARPHGIADGG